MDYRQTVDDFLKDVEPFIHSNRTTSYDSLGLNKTVVHFINTEYRNIYVKKWEDKLYFQEDRDSDKADKSILVVTGPTAWVLTKPDKYAILRFKGWLEWKGYEVWFKTGYESWF